MLPLLLLLSHISLIRADSFTEQLTVARLPSGNIAAYFNFQVNDVSKELSDHSYLFPPILTELVKKYSLSELSLSLGQGNWQSSKWGLPPTSSAPQGASIGAWFEDVHNETQVDDRWHHLVQSLNGLFCTSLSAMHPVFTSSIGKKPRGTHWKSETRSLRYGLMAEETVCTENLTPWRKLLPCKKSGLVTLLNPLRLYDSLFHSIGFNLWLECDNQECVNATWKLSLDATVVFDRKTIDGSLDFSFELYFGRSMEGECEVADKSRFIYSDDYYIPSFERPVNETYKQGERTFHLFDMKSSSMNEIVRYVGQRSILIPPPPPSIEVDAAMLGSESSLSATLEYGIYRGSGASAVAVSFFLLVPWYAQVHYASLEMICRVNREEYEGVTSHSFIPSISRVRPASIYYEVEVRSDAKCTVSFQLTRAFMKMAEYPSDANHGKYIPPAVVHIIHPDHLNGKESAMCLFSSPLLLTLPVPDFSMPFNVEAFVCVVISLCFSPILELAAYVMLPVGTVKPLPSKTKKIFRGFLYIITGLCIYAEMHQVSPAQIMRYGRAAMKVVFNATIEAVAPTSHQITG